MIVTFGFVFMLKMKTKAANVRIVIVNARIAQDYIAAIVEDCTIMWHICEEFFCTFQTKEF